MRILGCMGNLWGGTRWRRKWSVFCCLTQIVVTSQKARVNSLTWGDMRVSFLKGATKIIPPLAQRPRDSKILPQHMRKGWPFPELISYGAVLRWILRLICRSMKWGRALRPLKKRPTCPPGNKNIPALFEMLPEYTLTLLKYLVQKRFARSISGHQETFVHFQDLTVCSIRFRPWKWPIPPLAGLK